ncbi:MULTISPECIES: TonB-dependent receptor [unclassified Sphingomonas]|uniref:TonB-dependent receptor n=1 Tax=unclassified Sphingomonas TaxID=196159 RepID=UPI00226AAB9F|nr:MULTISPECIES: TonB-dependent receptor [unclassified Sphingomonas]
MAVVAMVRQKGFARKGLALNVSALAIVTAAMLPATIASAQEVPAPASRDDQSIPQTTPDTTGSVQTSVPAGAAAGKKPVSNSLSISNQAAEDQSNVTAADVQTPAANNVAAGSDIVVTGLRQSLANAQSIKRNADTVVDAITAEDIGALPDRSVNEALQRVPGVAISRFAAPSDSAHFSVEGSGVTIRGLSYVRGEFNGRDTFAAGAGREIGFNDVPTELVGSVEVYKNLTADLIEGGISGTVSINTRKPFDTKESLLYLSAGVNYGDLDKRGAPQGVALISKQFELGNGGRFGILGSASYSQQYSRSDSVFLAAMLPRTNDDTNGNGVQDAGEGHVINAGTPYASTIYDHFPVPDGQSVVYAPAGAGSRTQEFNRERIGFSAAAQYENASGNLLLTAQFLRADSREDWLEHTVEPNVYYSDVTSSFPAGYNAYAPIAGQNFNNYTFDSNGVFTSGTISHTGGNVFGNDPTRVCGTNTDGSPSHYCELSQFAPGSQFTTFSNRFFHTRAVTQDQSFNIKWEPTQRLHLNFDGQYVNSKADSIDDIVDTATYSQVNVDLRGGIPQITSIAPGFDTASYFSNPNDVYFRDAFNNRTINDGHEWSGKFDAQYDVGETSFLRKVKAGIRYADREQTVRTNDYSNWGAVSDTWTSGGPTYLSNATLPANSTALYNYTNFFRGGAITPPSTPYIADNILSNHDALEALLRQATAAAGGTYVPLEDRGTNLVDGYFLPSEVYRNGEKTYSAYVRLDFGLDAIGGGETSLSGNIGLRFVRTEDSSIGALTYPNANQIFTPTADYSTIAGYCAYTAAHPNSSNTVPVICTVTPAQQAAALAFANGVSFPDVANQSYNKFLPSLNIKYQLSPQLLFRFAGSKAISRPNFGSLRDYVGVNVSGSNTAGNFGFSASAQNPYLKPVDATQFDLTAEWYFAKVGQLTGALFYKDLSNIILDNYGYTRTLTNNGQTYDVQVNGPANASGHAHIKGAELSYQQTYDFLPGFLRGFGTQETFTYIDAGKIPNSVPANGAADGSRPPLDVTGIYDNLPLAGLSKYNFNASAFYDFAGVYARIAYSWRSKYLLTNRDCCFPYLPVFAQASGQMDGSLFYTVNKQFKIGVQVQNLLDATTKTTFLLNAQGLEAPRSFFKSDRQFQLSVRLTM